MKDHGQNHPGVISRDGEGAVIRGHVPVWKSEYHFLGEFEKSMLKLFTHVLIDFKRNRRVPKILLLWPLGLNPRQCFAAG